MNWPLALLAAYAAIAAALWVFLILDEAYHRGHVTWGGTVDALFCALLWPVIIGIILYERIGTWRKKRRGGDRP